MALHRALSLLLYCNHVLSCKYQSKWFPFLLSNINSPVFVKKWIICLLLNYKSPNSSRIPVQGKMIIYEKDVISRITIKWEREYDPWRQTYEVESDSAEDYNEVLINVRSWALCVVQYKYTFVRNIKRYFVLFHVLFNKHFLKIPIIVMQIRTLIFLWYLLHTYICCWLDRNKKTGLVRNRPHIESRSVVTHLSCFFLNFRCLVIILLHYYALCVGTPCFSKKWALVSIAWSWH